MSMKINSKDWVSMPKLGKLEWRFHVCKVCGRDISKIEDENNGGLCDYCFSEQEEQDRFFHD